MSVKKRVLITGGSGLLALNWAIVAKSRTSVILGLHNRYIELSGVSSLQVELGSVDGLARTLERLSIDLVVHTAGLTNIEKCESDPELANHVNVTLAKNVAKACALVGAGLVHISTDHLFDGKTLFVDETTPVCPLNIYGKTKAKAENEVFQIHSRSLLIRTNFYGWGTSYRYSFSDKILNALRELSNVTLFNDVFFTPILVETLATAVHDLVDMNIFGVHHVVSDQRLSKYEFARNLADEFSLDFSRVNRALLTKQTSMVCRPLDMSLSNKKVTDLLGRPLGDTKDQLSRLRKQEFDPFIKEIRTL